MPTAHSREKRPRHQGLRGQPGRTTQVLFSRPERVWKRHWLPGVGKKTSHGKFLGGEGKAPFDRGAMEVDSTSHRRVNSGVFHLSSRLPLAEADAEAHSEMGLLNYTNVGTGVVVCRPVPGSYDKCFLALPSLSRNEIHK